MDRSSEQVREPWALEPQRRQSQEGKVWAQLLLYPLHGPQVREEPLKHPMPPEYRNSSVTGGGGKGKGEETRDGEGNAEGVLCSFHYGLHSPPHPPILFAALCGIPEDACISPSFCLHPRTTSHSEWAFTLVFFLFK